MQNNLQHLRRADGWKSAKAFAEHIGMNPSTYAGYEQGNRPITLDDAHVFADALGCTIDDIAGRKTPTHYDAELVAASLAVRNALAAVDALIDKALEEQGLLSSTDALCARMLRLAENTTEKESHEE